MKQTKKSFLISIILLMLCISMFVGSTFAWFTDSVTSGKNKIVAGNLDIDFVMDKAQDGTYVSIAGEEGAIFGGENSIAAQNNSADTLWEPGKTQIVFLGVKNLGTLAAKYNIILTITDNGLAGALEYAIIDGAMASDLSSVSSWTAVKELSGVQNGKMSDITFDTTKKAVVSAANGGVLDEGVGETDYFALAVHMSEDAGNEYMGKDIVIDVLVEATQYSSENDSFDNKYDKQAEIESADYAVWYDLENMTAYLKNTNLIIDGEAYSGKFLAACDAVDKVVFTNQSLDTNDVTYEVEWSAPLNTVAHWDYETKTVVYTFKGNSLKFNDKTLLRFGLQKMSERQFVNFYNTYFVPCDVGLKPCATSDEIYAAQNAENSIQKLQFDCALSDYFVYTGVDEIVGLQYFDVSEVTDFTGTFARLDYIKTLDISSWNTSSAVNMLAMFYNSTSLEHIYVGTGWNTSKVTESSFMFYGADTDSVEKKQN